MAGDDQDIEGHGFAIVRPRPPALGDEPGPRLEPLVEPVARFLRELETVCVVACCGLAAYDTSDAAVREAVAGDGQPDLPQRLRRAAVAVGSVTAGRVSVLGGGDIATPGEVARWLEGLADTTDRLAGTG